MSRDRLANCFARCKSEKRAALVGFLTAGDPDVKTSEAAILTLAAKADIVEIGMPFSDPMADGPVIQAASERALKAGAHTDDVFRIASKVRQQFPEVGIVLMGYGNTAYAMGFEVFAERAKAAGVDGVLIVDIPPEESAELDAALKANHLHSIRLLSPTSSEARLKLGAQSASGFIYYVSLTGITGADMGEIGSIHEKLQAIRNYTALPICVGFGIKSPEQAANIAEFADGIVIGSHFVRQLSETGVTAVAEAAAAMRSAVHLGG